MYSKLFSSLDRDVFCWKWTKCVLIADPSAWTPQGQIAHITDRLYWKKRPFHGREGMWIRGEREKQGKWREERACANRSNKKSAHVFVSSTSLPWSSTRSRFIKYLTTILRRGQKGQKTRREEEAKEMKRGRDLRHINNIKSVSLLVSSLSSSIIAKEPIYKISYDNVTIILR